MSLSKSKCSARVSFPYRRNPLESHPVNPCIPRRYRKTKIGERDVKAHIYEYTTQISITPSQNRNLRKGRGPRPSHILPRREKQTPTDGTWRVVLEVEGSKAAAE